MSNIFGSRKAKCRSVEFAFCEGSLRSIMGDMCELFAMSSRLPATVTFSLAALARHGGVTGPHTDGWGIAYYEDGDLRLIKDPEPASNSPWVRFVEALDLRSSIVTAHIRRATRGSVSLANTHPFARELGGRPHLFAHNGRLEEVERLAGAVNGTYRPIGETDSERAFCALLHRLEEPWRGTEAPSIEDRIAILAEFAAELRRLGTANFLYSDGDVLFVHAHKRWNGREIQPPGLHLLCRRCAAETERIDGAGIALSETRQEVVLTASVPLTDEPWQPLEEGELLVLAGGRILARITGE